MEIILANIEDSMLKIESDLKNQVGAITLPFCGMDKSTAAVCQLLNSRYGSECEKGASCPFRHIRGDRTIVCKHWLRGLCKKGDQCEFLHEYDMKKMPECYFYSRFNACHNKECPFLHIDPESKVRNCPWYDRGFCRHGPHCRHRHVRRVLCINYLAGFCPSGWNCKYMHPRFELPPILDATKDQIVRKLPNCHICGELGHKASMCKKNRLLLPGNENAPYKAKISSRNMPNNMPMNTNNKPIIDGSEDSDSNRGPPGHAYHNVKKNAKPLEEITCYKCGNKGHYANRCPKGHLAFLSNQHSHK